MKPVVGAGNKLEINLTHQEIRSPGGSQHPGTYDGCTDRSWSVMFLI
jgi:hypothetical protein